MDEQLASRRAMSLLESGVPLSLLLDLGGFAPPSREILTEEGLPDVPWWEPTRAAG